ncbi:MAG: hypothetical protein HY371_07125 [Devosia nanyangense]|nr:hypothetical protein [Devosia nanyangense]
MGATILAQHALSALLQLGHEDLVKSVEASAIAAAPNSAVGHDGLNPGELGEASRSIITQIVASARLMAAVEASQKS